MQRKFQMVILSLTTTRNKKTFRLPCRELKQKSDSITENEDKNIHSLNFSSCEEHAQKQS